jgi:hypothetical protein
MGIGTGLLQQARQLVERGWTQHADARAADNSVVRPWDDRATTWSLLGSLVAAVERIAATDGEHTAIPELARTCILLADLLDTDSLEHWNDASERTGGDVIAALDNATALAASQHREPFKFSPN